MLLENVFDIDKCASVSVVGIPFDDNSSFMFGAAKAPKIIREGLASQSANYSSEYHIDLDESDQWADIGDMEIEDSYTAFDEIEQTISQILKKQSKIISLGGDHSITVPIMRAYSRVCPDINILQLDAHPDLYDSKDGNKESHASGFARIMEEKLAQRLVQAGIRTINAAQRKQADKFGVEVLEMNKPLPDLSFDGPVYLSLDMDCLDPAFAPGVAHHEPGGMSTRQVIDIIHQFKGQLIGADIVEFNPDRDPSGITKMVCAKLLREIIARILSAS